MFGGRPGPGGPRTGLEPQQPGAALLQPRPIRKGRSPLQARAGDLGKDPGPGAPGVAICLENYALCLRSMGRSQEAELQEVRARAIRALRSA